MIQCSEKLSDRANAHVAHSLNRLRQHPFLKLAQNRELSKEQITRWLMCAGRESRIFPNVVRNMMLRCLADHEEIRAILAQNLNDELGNGNPEEAHFRHYEKLLESMEISKDQFLNYEEGAGINLALSLATNVSYKQPLPVAIGYLLVNEGMTPVTYAAVGKSLAHQYQYSKIPFLEVHVAIDARHVAALLRAVDQLTDVDMERLEYGIALGERGMSILLDEAYGIFEYCQSEEIELLS